MAERVCWWVHLWEQNWLHLMTSSWAHLLKGNLAQGACWLVLLDGEDLANPTDGQLQMHCSTWLFLVHPSPFLLQNKWLYFRKYPAYLFHCQYSFFQLTSNKGGDVVRSALFLTRLGCRHKIMMTKATGLLVGLTMREKMGKVILLVGSPMEGELSTESLRVSSSIGEELSAFDGKL